MDYSNTKWGLLFPKMTSSEDQSTGIYAFTLPGLLGDMLDKAEDLYGARDATYTITGTEFFKDAPRIRYFGKDFKRMVFQLKPDCLADEVLACFQLALLCIHSLSPCYGKRMTVLHQGLAVHFASVYTQERCNEEMSGGQKDFDDACADVRELLEFDPAIVHKVREKQPVFDLMTPNDLKTACSAVPSDLAEKLVAPFKPRFF